MICENSRPKCVFFKIHFLKHERDKVESHKNGGYLLFSVGIVISFDMLNTNEITIPTPEKT